MRHWASPNDGLYEPVSDVMLLKFIRCSLVISNVLRLFVGRFVTSKCYAHCCYNYY